MIITNQESEIILDAIEKDNPSPILELYLNGFDINLKFKDGESILHKSFARQKYNTIQYLILLGANFNAVDENLRTPLHYASRNGFFDGCNLLLLLGANIDGLDHKNRTPLMHAIKFNQKVIVKTLMGRGSSSDVEDNNGFSPLLWVVKFMSSDDIKEITQENRTIQDKVNEQINDCANDNIEVSDSIQEAIQVGQSQIETDESVAPETASYLKDFFSKAKDKIIQAASYSIKEHLQSLKDKEQPAKFEYERKIIDDEDGKNTADSSYSLEESTFKDSKKSKNLEEKMSYTLNSPLDKKKSNHSEAKAEDKEVEESESIGEAESFSKNEKQKSPVPARQESDSFNSEVKNEIKESEKRSEVGLPQKESIKKSTYEAGENLKEEVKESSSKTESMTDEIPRLKRPEINVNTYKAEDIRKPEKREVDKEVEEERVISAKQTSSEIEKEEIAKILNEDIEEELKNEIKSPIQKNKTSDVHDDGSDTLDETIIVKKSVTYLRDGYSEVYKTEYGAINKVDKKVDDDIFGTLKSGNRVIKEELGEIKAIDKTIESDKEVKELKHSGQQLDGYNPLTNANAPSVTREAEDKDTIRVKSSPTNLKVSESEKIKRPVLNDTPIDNKVVNRTSVSRDNTIPDSADATPVKADNSESGQSPKTVKIKALKTSNDSNEDIVKSSNESGDAENTQAQENSTEVTSALSIEEEKILKSVIDVNQRNSKGQTLCWLASEKGQINLLKKIIHDGADYEIKDLKGVSCLMAAAVNGHIDVIDYLSHKVRNIDEKNTEGNTALILAVESDRADVARALVNNGANIETKIKGNTLLMHAAFLGNIECIKLFILLGIDPMEKNFRGKTAIDLAKTSKNKKAFLILSKVAESRGRNIRKKE